ncbi:hypothetical protein GIB67_023482, partial [Kingdonia uniflora]
EDKEPNNQATHINVTLAIQDGVPIDYRIRKSFPLNMVLQTFCKVKSLEFKEFVFLLDGQRVLEHQFSHELGMEDGDRIEVVTHLWGGGA